MPGCKASRSAMRRATSMMWACFSSSSFIIGMELLTAGSIFEKKGAVSPDTRAIFSTTTHSA
ncbi:MAG: hypothetical protein IJP65_01495 [Bacteroidales bacterium]|nr:hypothetical protein [Bacteroidales bacterium]